MNRTGYLAICLIAVSILLSLPMSANAPKNSGVAWFSDNNSQGLRQDSRGDLIVSGRRLSLEKPVARLFAAAYYPSAGMLVTVDRNAVTQLHERSGALLRLKLTRPPHEISPKPRLGRIRPVVARFCNVPGLVYLTWSYPQPGRMAPQIATRFTERLALGSWARNWHAVTPSDSSALFLNYTYHCVSPRLLHLHMPDGKSTTLHLPGQLAGVVDTQWPYVELEPVSVVPDRAIFCRSRNGWSMHNLNGSLISYFSARHLNRWGWQEPFYRNGHYYVGQADKGMWYYRMEVTSGKLVYVGEHLP